jgi:hypothetical protein
MVKLHGTKIVSGKATDRKEVIYDVESMQNTIKVERARKYRVNY